MQQFTGMLLRLRLNCDGDPKYRLVKIYGNRTCKFLFQIAVWMIQELFYANGVIYHILYFLSGKRKCSVPIANTLTND